MKPKKVLSIGDALIDFVSQTSGCGLDESAGFEKAPGGACANVAAAVAKLGGTSGFIGKVGEDPFGDFLKSTFDQLQVETSHLLRTTEAKTCLAFVSLKEDGERDFIFYRDPSADMLLRPEELDESYIQTAAILHFGSVSLSAMPSRAATLQAVQLAKNSQVTVSFDPNYRPSMWGSEEEAFLVISEALPYADVLKINEEEMVFLTQTSEVKKAAEQLHQIGIPFVIITLGAAGCYYSCLTTNGCLSGSIPGIPVKAIDTTGAGDAFVGGMLSKLSPWAGEDSGSIRLGSLRLPDTALLDALHYGIAASALSVMKKGAISSLPDPQVVEELLAERRAGEKLKSIF